MGHQISHSCRHVWFIALIGVLLVVSVVAIMPQSVSAQSNKTTSVAEQSREAGWGEMTTERRQEAIAYSHTKDIFFFVTFGYSILLLIVILYSGLSGRLLAWAEGISNRRWSSLAIYLLAFLIILEIASLPLTYYLGFALEHKYGLSNQSLGAWSLDWLKSFGVGFVVLYLLIGILYALIRRFPKSWWAWTGVVAVPVVFFLIVLSPIVITPLFYDQTPMEDGQLKSSILNLAAQSGIDESRVFVLNASKDTKKLNAYVTGLRKTKRIVLYDNLLNTMDPDETLFVVGHEMGHYVLNHVWIGFATAVVLIFIFAYLTHRFMARLIARGSRRFGFDHLASIASLPLIWLSFSMLGFVTAPIQNGLSRHFEHEADVFGLDLTASAQAAVGAFEKLADANLSNPNPSAFIRFWRYSHPTLSERVQFAQGYGDERGNGGSAAVRDSLRSPGETHLRNIHQLTFGGENAEAYFDARGEHLTFQSKRNAYDCDRIYRMKIDGSGVQLISVPGGVTTCSFIAPDGKRVIYSSTYLVDDSCPPKPDYSMGYVWPVYAAYDIFSAKPDGSDLKRLTDTQGYDAEGVYSPDGSKILFTSVRDGDLDLYTMDPDGRNVKRLTSELGYDGGAFYSADGSKIVYRAHHPTDSAEIADYKSLLSQGLIRPSKLEIFVMDADGSNKHKVTSLGAASFCPFFHPDGKRIIFSSNNHAQDGRTFDLFMINVDGSGLTQITHNDSFDGFPMFNRDGTKLVWASNRNNAKPYETNVFIADWVD